MSLPIVDETATELMLAAGADPKAVRRRRKVVAAYHCEVLGLSTERAARLAGVTPDAVQRWKRLADWHDVTTEARGQFKSDILAAARTRVLDTIQDDDHPEATKTARWALEKMDSEIGASSGGQNGAGNGVTIVFGSAPAGIMRVSGPDGEVDITPSEVVDSP